MNEKQLVDILMELSNATKKISDVRQVQDLIDKYDMIFAGKSYNCINTIELRHTIDKFFHIKITLEELNSLVPSACSMLGMEIVPIVKATSPIDPIPYCYEIFL